MGMREYHNLKDIIIPEAQEKIMDIFCKAWEGCRASGCHNCPDRPKNLMAIMECTALKYSRMLIEAGYTPVVHGRWGISQKKYSYYQYCCSVCGCDNYSHITRNGMVKPMNFCPNCGAKMDEEEKHG